MQHSRTQPIATELIRAAGMVSRTSGHGRHGRRRHGWILVAVPLVLLLACPASASACLFPWCGSLFGCHWSRGYVHAPVVMAAPQTSYYVPPFTDYGYGAGIQSPIVAACQPCSNPCAPCGMPGGCDPGSPSPGGLTPNGSFDLPRYSPPAGSGTGDPAGRTPEDEVVPRTFRRDPPPDDFRPTTPREEDSVMPRSLPPGTDAPPAGDDIFPQNFDFRRPAPADPSNTNRPGGLPLENEDAEEVVPAITPGVPGVRAEPLTLPATSMTSVQPERRRIRTNAEYVAPVIARFKPEPGAPVLRAESTFAKTVSRSFPRPTRGE